MLLRPFWDLVKKAAEGWLEDKADRLGAALAYYAIFSMAPLLVIAIAVAGLVFGEDAAQGRIAAELRDYVGLEGSQAIQEMLRNVSTPSTNILATVIGVVVLFFGAMGLFGQLQDALNTIWEVQPKPGRGLWGIIHDRLLSFAMVLGTAFLLLASLIASAILTAVGSLLDEWQVSLTGHAINAVVSFGVLTLIFAMIYKFLPDARIAWRDVWLGAAITAALFTFGKWLLGLYLGRSTIGSAYGAAGSLAVLLVWLYYSAQIFLFGAELTKVYADTYGGHIVPTDNAVRVTDLARAQQGIPCRPDHQSV